MVRGMTAQDLILNLRAAGFEADVLERFLACWQDGETGEQLRLLAERRKALLDRVHQEEKQIGCLDYLTYRIEKDRGTPGQFWGEREI